MTLVSRKVGPFLAAAYSVGLLLLAPRDQAHAQVEDRIVILGSTPKDVADFQEALTKANRTVWGHTIPIVIELSCGVRLDLTGEKNLFIGSNRSLIASPACARGPRTPTERVPLIFVRDNRRFNEPLFWIDGDFVVISGFYLRGPTEGVAGQDSRLERAIRIEPADAELPTPINKIEISNMEIFQWSGAGIDIRDKQGRLFKENAGAVTIKGNFIHNNQHDAGNGYGVEVGKGAYALIEKNVFDLNRHAMAGGSHSDKEPYDYSGYTFSDNLILPGGGLHCSAAFGIFNCWWTHQIDMHGDRDTSFLGVTTSEHCCGTAGEKMLIQRNTVLYMGKGTDYGLRAIDFVPEWLYEVGLAIKIRGNPTNEAVVENNIFKHRTRGDAIDQNGGAKERCSIFGWPCYGWRETPVTNPLKVISNVFGEDPLSGLNPALDSCDFSGSRDGKKDVFMATGVTWWAKSPVDGQWRYLNTMPEKRPQLQLTDIDGDGICDVAEPSPHPGVPPRRVSKSGTGPWITWPIGPNPN